MFTFRVKEKTQKETGKADFVLNSQNLRRYTKQFIKQAHKELETKTEANVNKNPREFWNYINKKSKSNENANTVEFNRQTIQNSHEIVKTLAQQFSSIFLKPPLSPSTLNYLNNHNIKIKTYSLREEQTMYNLKSKGSDQVPPIIQSL